VLAFSSPLYLAHNPLCVRVHVLQEKRKAEAEAAERAQREAKEREAEERRREKELETMDIKELRK
jgi:hypothetical protein